MSPTVTVLMSVYNEEKYLHEAIDSILNQTYTDIEFIIIDDGSTDLSQGIILSYDDPRIRFIENNENIGLVNSLNKGLKIAKGEYIARMDADDKSMPRRLEEQVNFMEKKPNVGVCGTMAQFINEKSKVINLRNEEKIMYRDEEMKAELLFRPCFIHPTVIFRSKLLRTNNLNYEEIHGRFSQDYYLWYILSSLCEFANISRVLFEYRVHEKQISKGSRNDQFIASESVRRIILENFLKRKVNKFERIKHARISVLQHSSNLEEIDEIENWLKLFMRNNEENKRYKMKSLEKVLQNLWILNCMNSSHLGLRLLIKYFSSFLWEFRIKNMHQEIQLFIKCVIKYKVKLFPYHWDRIIQDDSLTE